VQHRRAAYGPEGANLAEVGDRTDELARELGPDVAERVRALQNDHTDAVLNLVVWTIAAHLPGLGPAIHALADHALQDDPLGGCCGLPAAVPIGGPR
jgi:hypothetical protein